MYGIGEQCEICIGKLWFKVADKVCHPYMLWLSPIDECDCRYQLGWIPMAPRTYWYSEVGSVNY